MLIMVCYFKKICGINQAKDRVTWPDLLHRRTSALASFREWSAVSAWLRIWAQLRNPCQPRNSASASTCLLWQYMHDCIRFRISWSGVPMFLDCMCIEYFYCTCNLYSCTQMREIQSWKIGTPSHCNQDILNWLADPITHASDVHYNVFVNQPFAIFHKITSWQLPAIKFRITIITDVALNVNLNINAWRSQWSLRSSHWMQTHQMY